MGAPLRALRGRSAINNIKIITVFIFWGEEYRSLYRGLQSWYGGSLAGRSVRRHPTSTIVIEFFGVRLLHVIDHSAFVTSTRAKTWKWGSGGQASNMAGNIFTSSRGGLCKYCCVPGCKNYFYNNQGEKTNISFLSFPLEAKSRNRWLLAIKRQENRDGFVVTEYTKVCEGCY